jgi:peptidyl-prolyl cis-trans isomerase B (cyclophilin B)
LKTEPQMEVRMELYFALGLQGTAADLPTLVEAISQPTHKTHTAEEVGVAAQAIGRMAMRGIWQATTQAVVLRLAEQHRRPQVSIRRGAAFSLARIKPQSPSSATRLLMVEAAQSEPDAIAQAWFVRATGGLQGIHADLAELYTESAEDPAPGVRIATVRAGAQAGWTGVAFLLDDPDPEVRIAAIAAVGQLKNLDSAQLLGPIVEEGARLSPPSSPDEAMPAKLAEAAAALRALDNTALWAETETARYSRVQVGLEPSLSQYLSPDFCTQIRMAAASVNPDARQLMRVMSEDAAAEVRVAAITRLLGSAGGTQRAVQLLASPNDTIKAAAAEWLANEPAAMAEAPLLRLASQSNSADVVRASVTALGRMYSVQKRTSFAAKALVPGLLRHSDPAIRSAGAGLARAMRMPQTDSADVGQIDALESLLTIRGARIETTFGTAVIQLFPEEAPQTVQNFAKLAEAGFFDGLSFHRVVPDFVVQGGDPRGDGWGGPGYTLPDEINPKRHGTGAVGMALSGRDTAGSQWYATLSPQPHLDGQYTVFGQVTQGLQVLRSMLPGDRIEHIRIERIPVHAERLAAEMTRAKKSKDELAAQVKPRKKSKRTRKLLAKHYPRPKTVKKPTPPPPPPPPIEADEPDEATISPKPAAAPAKRDSLPDQGAGLPDDHEKMPEQAPIKEGEKVEFETDEDDE